MSKAVYICEAKRTAIGSFLGSLKQQTAVQLGAAVIQDILKETALNPAAVDEVIVGNVLAAGLGQGVGRQVAIKGGLPQSVCAYSLNMVCGSGLKAVMNGKSAIEDGAGLILAGGVESMSQAPFILPGAVRNGKKMGAMTLVDSMLHDGLTDAFDKEHMGMTAERLANQYQISREAQDAYAYASQQKAIAAVDAGIFDKEIVEVDGLARDEYPNRKTTLEKLATLRPAFTKEGTVTAGNASGINDGASFVLLADEAMANQHHLEKKARIVACAQAGVDPKIMGIGPVPAIRKALDQAGLTLQDIDCYELNEAFAVQSLAVMQDLFEGDMRLLERVNPHGGAIALGHPIGASGNRILVTLIHRLLREQKRYGLASLCIGGGMGVAVIVENTTDIR